MLLLLLVGCGDISNGWILEDAAFLDALPTEDRQTVSLGDFADDAAAKGIGDAPSLLQASYAVSSQVNLTILQVLWAVDDVRALRPTTRTADGRTWGPFAWRDGVDLRAEMTRSGTGRFDWELDAQKGDAELRFLTGTHYAGDTVADGDGSFTWELDDVAAMLGEDEAGTVVVDYDNREGVDLLVDIDGVTDGSTAPTTARYAYRLTTDGDFQYATAMDLDGDGLLEDVSVRTRWTEGAGGRSDAVFTGGTLGPLSNAFTQCWDGALALTYEDDTAGWVAQTGTEDRCLYPDFATVDRL